MAGGVVEVSTITPDGCGGVVEIDAALARVWDKRRERPVGICASPARCKDITKAVLGLPYTDPYDKLRARARAEIRRDKGDPNWEDETGGFTVTGYNVRGAPPGVIPIVSTPDAGDTVMLVFDGTQYVPGIPSKWTPLEEWTEKQKSDARRLHDAARASQTESCNLDGDLGTVYESRPGDDG